MENNTHNGIPFPLAPSQLVTDVVDKPTFSLLDQVSAGQLH